MLYNDIADYIVQKYRKVAEIGIGHAPRTAFSLKMRGLDVFATDTCPLKYEGLDVVIDDITSPCRDIYRDRELIYSMKPPLELIPYMLCLAREITADVIVKTLSSEHPNGSLARHRNTVFYEWVMR